MFCLVTGYAVCTGSEFRSVDNRVLCFVWSQAMQYVQALNSERSGRPKTEVLEEDSTDAAVSVCVCVCVCIHT